MPSISFDHSFDYSKPWLSCCGARHLSAAAKRLDICRPLPFAQLALSATGSARIALPLGELSPQVTERVLQPVLNGKVNLFAHATKISVNITVGKP